MTPPVRVMSLVRVSLLAGIMLCAAMPNVDAQQRGGGPPPAAPVGIDRVRVEILSETMPVIGRLVAAESGIVASRIAERVAEVVIRLGDRVERGAVLARLSPDLLVGERTLRIAERGKAQAQVARAKANLAEARRALNRISALRDSTAYREDRQEQADRDADIALSALRQAEAELLRANANLALADLALADADITAPYPGVVIARHVVAGNYVRVGDPIVTLLNDSRLEIEADVPAVRTGGLQPGTRVSAVLQDGTAFEARVRAVIPEENPRTRTRSVRMVPQIDGPGTRLAGNQSVTVEMPIGAAREVVTVHKDAVIMRGAKAIVYTVENETAAVRTLRKGRAVGNRFEVLDGLEPDEIVVVRGNERLRPGQAIKPLGPG